MDNYAFARKEGVRAKVRLALFFLLIQLIIKMQKCTKIYGIIDAYFQEKYVTLQAVKHKKPHRGSVRL